MRSKIERKVTDRLGGGPGAGEQRVGESATRQGEDNREADRTHIARPTNDEKRGGAAKCKRQDDEHRQRDRGEYGR